ncbi:CAP domain-containing protein [Lacticaseibacillus saniviri]|uniref:SCP domain-containing protein n=1 Tax=Lacticaseibacillus saniviri JCM 17471 = DSM 24301 TaxID=1293598 RepID=A0A0R2MWZ4_9LACO|nr:CAP domain-containing protein [Lacticaseibacillus saniviri]KRO16914.1 hypothetical protein IV56_GL000601 [Lacticaseibacillus saniviri JCM 17471 = DSM 24301]MCG4281979.1 CAP domain-containing protein [Lacticaseibacillus saniviri]
MKKFITASALVLMSLSAGIAVVNNTSTATPVYAATTVFSQKDLAQIAAIKKTYSQLDQTVYPYDDLYAEPPRFDYPFSAGKIKPQYVDASVDWMNYFREIAGLTAVPATDYLNKKSQIAAASMAAAQVNPNLDQHGLNNASKPYYVPASTWSAAKDTTSSSNLYFHYGQDSPSDTISALIADNFNLNGSNDTGHRAWMLSSRLSAFGIGVAIGSNGWRFANQSIINPSDYTRTPTKNIVTYPGNGVFPIEELTQRATYNNPIPWSAYFASGESIPTTGLSVTIKNDTTGKVGSGAQVGNYNQGFFGGYDAVITFIPKNVTLTAGNQYTVTIKGLGSQYPNGYTYSFKLFNVTQGNTTGTTTSNKQVDTWTSGSGTIKYVSNYSIATWNQPGNGRKMVSKLKSGSTVKYVGRNYSAGTYWYKLSDGTWIDGTYLQTGSAAAAGAKTVNYAPGYGIAVWNSPYFNKRATGKTLKTGTRWKTFKTVTVNNHTWYNLGGNQWMDGSYLK